MHTHPRILFRDGREIRGTCESEGDGGEFERRARIFVRARGGVSDVESGKTGGEIDRDVCSDENKRELTMRGASWHRLPRLIGRGVRSEASREE